MAEKEQLIRIYATNWCGDSRRARRLFEENQVPFEWIDIDQNPEAEEFVLSINHGFRSVPTIVFPDGTILVEPSAFEIRRKLNLE